MKFMFFCSFFLLCSFPLYSSPVSLGACLILISFSFVAVMASMSSWWYAYILFLVYIGGLLVMFIYVCLISSNYNFMGSNNQYFGVISLSTVLTYALSMNPMSKDYLGYMSYDMGSSLVSNNSIWLFGGLVILLLVMLLIIVRSSGAGAVSVN
uniref:NADH dehydrogenase subunit 6 n=1 Tax=Sagaminopteron nigropunctatum TaxID=1874340 RepID=E6Y1D3_9GAST|nr:NADH dehydrogenase subunit 6 [Sagaminopteron nigropunctatum]